MILERLDDNIYYYGNSVQQKSAQLKSLMILKYEDGT